MSFFGARQAEPAIEQGDAPENELALPRLLEVMSRQNEENIMLQAQRQELFEAGQRVTREAEELFMRITPLKRKPVSLSRLPRRAMTS